MPRPTSVHQILTLACAIAAPALVLGCGDDNKDKNPPTNQDGGSDSGTPDAGPDGSTPGDGGVPPDGGNPAPTADTWVLTSGKRLAQVERATGKVERAVALTGIPAGENLLGLDFRPADGVLYVLTSAGKLYTVDRQSGAATLKSTLAADATDSSSPYTALAGQTFGVDFNPVADRLRIVSSSGQNLRVNVDSGATFTDAQLNAAASGVSAAAYTHSFGGACRTQLWVIDATSRKFYLQNPPNEGTLTEQGTGLGDAAGGSVRGFDIGVGATGNPVGVVVGAAADGERISDIDLATGALSNPRKVTLDAGETLEAIAIAPPTTAPAQAPGELVAVTVGNRLVSFNRGAPGKLCTNVAIGGLAANEQLLGADVRPADNALYGITDQGKIYTLNLTTGAATVKSTLSAASGDDEPYAVASLTGTEIGAGFNPAADRLRVITKAGISLRIDVNSGATTTDTVIHPDNPQVTALGYTNSVSGPADTTLFAIDVSTETLVRIGGAPASSQACTAGPNDSNPNCGDVEEIGNLELGPGDLADTAGFDIQPPQGSSPQVLLAAFSQAAATQAKLYTINVSSGAATAQPDAVNNTIGVNERVRSLALAPTTP